MLSQEFRTRILSECCLGVGTGLKGRQTVDPDSKIGLTGRQKADLAGKIGLEHRQKGDSDGKIGLEGRLKVDTVRSAGRSSQGRSGR